MCRQKVFNAMKIQQSFVKGKILVDQLLLQMKKECNWKMIYFKVGKSSSFM